MPRAPLVALAALVLLSAGQGFGAPPAPPTVRAFTVEAVAVACAREDGVCLAYGGAVPGPTMDVNLGDTLEVTLVNRIAETLAPLDVDDALKARLSAASVSWHVHGTAVAADMDGVAAHDGTRLVASVAPPGGSFTYRTRAAHPGPWHYHDHVLGVDGAEGTLRGLYGGLVVRSGAEPRPPAVLDLHLHDDGANGGRGLPAEAPRGAELLVVGLGNRLWDVRIEGPTSAAFALGPGMSERVRLAQPGIHHWSATTALGDVAEGEVVVR